MEKKLYTSDAAKILGLGVSTLRNYAIVLESKGYRFERGANNGRIFREKDIQEIQTMMSRMIDDGMTVDQAAEATARKFPRQEPDGIAAADIEKLCEKISLLEKQQTDLTEINRKLAVQVERLTEKIEDRERDQQLFQMREDAQSKKKSRGISLLRTFTFLDKKTTV
ncbi:hypothetical protein ACFSCZ_09590 [Siminovitchia sediminis]|uniref:MerR family transcriptional regulator n=1 Tax=Siminovitchia sediminis TaxID=1274353 RepID=A0ABW4KFX7_9BACI